MNCPDLIMTIGKSVDKSEMIRKMEFLLNHGVTYYRFNFAKHITQKDILKRCEDMEMLNNYFCSKLKFLIDLPFPGKKVRFFFDKNNGEYETQKGEVFIITDLKTVKNEKVMTLYVNEPNLIKKVHIGMQIPYSDGECFFTVTEVAQEGIYVQISNSIKIYSGKAIHIGYVHKELDFPIIYKEVIDRLQPYAVAGSFIESKEDAIALKSQIGNHTVFSKIESELGVQHIKDVLNFTDIILGRGDLLLNCSIKNFCLFQDYVAQQTQERNKKLYVATGILTSMFERSIPTQADLNDLIHLLKLRPNGLILNTNTLLSANLERTLDIVMSMAEKY